MVTGYPLCDSVTHVIIGIRRSCARILISPSVRLREVHNDPKKFADRIDEHERRIGGG